MNTVDWALVYARCGWRSFPVKPGEKSPVYNGWQQDSTTDPELIRRYWPEALNRNLGLVCGESFDAWDIEVQHLGVFDELWAKNILPETPIARTGRGGLHILTQPTGVGGSRYLYLDGVHIGELKSSGGFILACPSVTTGSYAWKWAPDRMEVAEAPTWLLGLVREPQKPKMRPWKTVSLAPMTDLQPLLNHLRTAHDGSRNSGLHWAANRACDDGVPHDLAERELLAVFMELSQPGEDRFEREHEARATIASAYTR